MDSSIFDQLNNIINNKNEFEEFKNYMGLDESFFESTDKDFEEKSNKNNDKNNILSNIDLNQMILINNVIQNLSNNSHDKSTDLLLSLKPFLSNDKKQKINIALNFIKIMKIAPLLQNLNMFSEGEKNNEDTK